MTYELRCPWCGYLVGKVVGTDGGVMEMPCPRRRCKGPSVVRMAFGDAVTATMTVAPQTVVSSHYLTVTQM